MMTHLRQVDEADRTVILMQVENESGLMGSVRDYSPESNKLFNGPVPASLVTALKKKPGTWTEVFGSRLAEETFTAYYLSSFINEIAKAGKQVYPLATYVNAWEGGEDTADAFDSFDRAGESYPAAGRYPTCSTCGRLRRRTSTSFRPTPPCSPSSTSA